MNNKNQLKDFAHYPDVLSRRLLLQYFTTIIGYMACLGLFVLLAWQFFSMFIWYESDPFYWVLHFIKQNLWLFVGVPAFIGWTFITYRFIIRILGYLDEVVQASEQLASPTTEPIVLSPIMAETQQELNRVREKALLDAKAAKDAEQRKNDLIVYLAHDLKTPLTSVIGYLTLLRDESQISEPLRQKYLSISLEKAERLEDLINEFFDITRFNLSSIELQYGKINLTRLLEQLTFEFQPMLIEKQLQCHLNIPPDSIITCDVNQLQRVFDNLLRNAVFYSFENSVITITVMQHQTETAIQFVNCGNTIPPEKLTRIFEQFYRLDTSRSSHNGGAGLGLAIAKEIVELHGGAITADSKGETITFTVTLPRL